MFEGIKLKTFLSTHQEWHAFLIGFFETLCPWKARQPLPERYVFPFSKEYHYYMAGRGAGFIALLLMIISLCKLAQEVLL